MRRAPARGRGALRQAVELLGRYSSRPDLLDRLRRVDELARQHSTTGSEPSCAQLPPPFKLSRRLSSETTAELIAAYEAGSTALELAERYSLGKTSVLRLLRAHGAAMRRQPMTSEQVSEAAQLYRSGLSITQVSDRLGVPTRTLYRALRSRGVRTRDTHGRERP